jgi:hypothetical protein
VFAKGLKSINWKRNFKILMDSVEDYARQWAKREKEDLDTLSEWVSFVYVVGVYVGLPSELSIPNAFIKQAM